MAAYRLVMAASIGWSRSSASVYRVQRDIPLRHDGDEESIHIALRAL